MSTPQVWLVWSNEHAAWWKVGDRGYTHSMVEAARYTREDALARCHKMGPWKHPGIPDEVAVVAPDENWAV